MQIHVAPSPTSLRLAGKRSPYPGFLQADAFGGYDGIYGVGRVIDVGCNGTCWSN